MVLIDIGGQKNRIDLDRWKIMDIRPGSEYEINLNEFDAFPVRVVDAYYTSHTLEHLSPLIVEKVLREMYVTLKFGGKLRIVVPDISIGIDWYLHFPEKLSESGTPTRPIEYPLTPLGFLLSWILTPDKGSMGGHKMAFDWTTLFQYLVKAGFSPSNITKMKYGECSSEFIGKDLPRYKDYSLYVEAVK